MEVNEQARYIPTIDERVEMHLEDETYTLVMCPRAWSINREVVNVETGETRPMRCGSWGCLYCGPRKVDEWRQLIAEAAPTLHLTLTKAGKTVDEAARALTTFMQALRRGSKGRGKSRVGARPAYPVEYFAVLERHENFEENGFHWHILLRGVDSIPYKEVIEPLWTSATHGKASYGWIRRVENSRAIGYVTKYLTKDIGRVEKGIREVEYEVAGLRMDENGMFVEDRQIILYEMESRARRIRYSRGFFPESTRELRLRLFSPVEASAGETLTSEFPDEEQEAVSEETGEQQQEKRASRWCVREIGEAIGSVREYKARLRERLTEVVADRVANGRRLSRRVLTVWNYQRQQVEYSSV